MKLSDVFNVLTANEYMVAGSGFAHPGEEYTTPGDNYVVVYDKNDVTDHGMHTMKRVYKVLPEGDLEEINIRKMVDEVKEALKSKVSVDDLLEQVLTTGGPTSLIRTHGIISKYPEVADKIEPRKGCLYLDIPNPEPGQPNESLYLRF